MRRVIKSKISLAILLGFFYSAPSFAINSWQQAMDQCLAPLPPGGGGNYCKTYYETDICGVTLASGAQGYIRREWDGFTAFCSTSNTYVFGDDGCPAGQNREPVGGACVCPSGQTWNGTSCAAPIVQDCPKDQYRNGSNNCVAAPDCNEGNTLGGDYFDVETASCLTGEVNICMTDGPNTVNCPPLSDCIAVGQICSNNQANLDDAATTQPARNAAAKDTAETANEQAASASADAAAAAAAKEAASAAAQANKAAAESAAAQQQAIDPTSQATADALATAAAAASEAAQAAQKAINSAAQALKAATEAARAAADDAAIEPTTGGGTSENLSYDAGLAAGLAIGALQGAIQGRALDGSPGGSGSGDDMGNCPGCATETTLQNLMAGSGNAKAAPGSGSFDQSGVDAEEAAVKAEFEALITTIRGEIESVISFDQAGPGALPVIQYGTIKGKEVSADYSRFSSQLSWLGYTILFAAAIISAMIIFG